MKPGFPAAPLLALMIAACSTAPVAPPSAGHLEASPQAAPVANAGIPQPVQNTVTPPKPRASAKVETYSVVVNNVRVQDLLFALARDAKVNVDVHPGIMGTVTLNAIDQSLPQLLTRIAKQVDMRWEMDGPNLVVMPDSPYLQTYRVDYVNMSRETLGSMTVTTQVASTGAGASATSGGAATGGGGNNSQTQIKNVANHHFWETLKSNVEDLLQEEDKIRGEIRCGREMSAALDAEAASSSTRPGTVTTPATGPVTTSAGPGTESDRLDAGRTEKANRSCGQVVPKPSVIVNAETGIVTARGTARQHAKIQEFLSQVMASARRQVLIEATIAEVTLSDNYQQGIDWKVAPLGGKGFTITQLASTVAGSALPREIVNLAYNNTTSRFGSITAAVKLLDEFGTVKVLSSPKMSVLNNQTAVLKVVDNLVYFTIKADTTSNANTTTTTYTTNLNSVPVGLVMNVTPQISENDTVLLNIRPSISRKFGEVIDPNPDLQRLGVENKIPVIRTREMESMIRVENGNIAVMGGLMEDGQENSDSAIPAISRIPFLGNFFQNKNDTRRKTELVVFLRPVVIKNASIDGDYASFRGQLPNSKFFDSAVSPGNRIGNDGSGR